MPADPKKIIERMLTYWRGTAFLYGLCVTLLWIEVELGKALPGGALWLTTAVLLGLITFRFAIPRYETLRFPVDQLALAQGMWAIACIVFAYSIAAEARGAIISLILVVLVFCAFALAPKASHTITAFSLLILGLTMIWKSNVDPLNYPAAQEALHFVLAFAATISVVILTGQFNLLRGRLKRQKQDLQDQVRKDELTSLPNRRGMRELLDDQAESSAYGNSCVVLLDLDRFKSVNDLYGHAAGDMALRKFSESLRRLLRANDHLGRWGGEEFLLLLPDTEEIHGLDVLNRVRQQLPAIQVDPVLVLPLTFSAGLTLRQPGEALEKAVNRADKALQIAKREGRDRIRLFDPELEHSEREKENRLKELERAIANEEFILFYQPQHKSGEGLIGFEALLRWKHPALGLLSPSGFIPLAEESGLILEIGRQIQWLACLQLAKWRASSSTSHLTVSINVSAFELRHPDFVLHIQRSLVNSGAPADRLKLEITESALIDGADATISKMEVLRKLGVSWSLDDFGTGYSSLSYLNRLPLSQLKIDRSFVKDCLEKRSASLITKSVVALGHGLGLDVLAEGVESEEQLEFLINCGCLHFQGYLLGKPGLIDDVLKPEHYQLQVAS